MKPTSPYATLHAFGVGTVAGCVGAVVLTLAFKYLGVVGFYGVCLVVGASSWGLAELLDRRARRRVAELNGLKTQPVEQERDVESRS